MLIQNLKATKNLGMKELLPGCHSQHPTAQTSAIDASGRRIMIARGVWMSRAERRREMRGQEKKEVTRVMTIAQIQQMKKDMADLIADELLMKVVGIAALIIHDKFGMLMKKEVDGKSREERFIDEWERQYKLFEAGRMTLEDIQEVLRDECGITMKREDAQHREWM